jgi:hypothetical protein
MIKQQDDTQSTMLSDNKINKNKKNKEKIEGYQWPCKISKNET